MLSGRASAIDIPIVPDQNLDDEYKQVTKSKNFILLFVILSYTIAYPMFFSMNVKTFGLGYFGDATIGKISFVGSAVMFACKMTSGYFLDKYGLIKIYKISLGVSLIAVILFDKYRDNVYMFYLIYIIFY